MQHEPITHPIYNQSYKRWYRIQRQTGASHEAAARIAHRYSLDAALKHQAGEWRPDVDRQR